MLVEPLGAQRPLAIGLGLLLAAEILFVSYKGLGLIGANNEDALLALNQDPGNVKEVARVLFNQYLLPFEVTSILLVVAIVGVMVLARRIGRLGATLPREPATEEEAAA